MLPDNIPLALRPAYSVAEPNQPITLYEGHLKVIQEGKVLEGSGTVCFVWFPYPQVKFELTNYDLPLKINPDEASLSFPELGASAKAFISNSLKHHGSGRNQVSGYLKKPMVTGSVKDLAYVQFHLTNFHHFYGAGVAILEQDSTKYHAQKVAFEAAGWRVTINELKTTKDSVESLESQGGYVVTHVGKLERSDDKAFEADEEFDKFLKALAIFLSFVRGFRISPLLLVGYDKSDKCVWRKWGSENADSFRSVYSWFPIRDAQRLAGVFPGFVDWLQDWGETAELTVYWYLESNDSTRGQEGSIILEQAALELLAWVFLVEKSKVVSEEDFKDPNNKQFNKASRKINRLLERLGIDTEIPCSLTELIQFEEKLKHSSRNGPYALTEVRNNIIHSAPENRQAFHSASSFLINESWLLGRQYLELALLRLSNYQGTYFNYLVKEIRCESEVEDVPWNKSLIK